MFKKRVKISSWLLVVIFLLFVFGLILRFNSFSAPFERDEGEYAYSAWILKEGLLPYRDAFMQKPPLIIYTYLVAQIFGGNSLWAPRVLAFVFEFLATLVFGYIIFKEFNKKLAIAAMFFLTPALTFPVFMGLTANTEMFMILPFLLTLLFYVRDKEESSSLNFLFSGIASSLAILYKPICLYALVFIYLVWITGYWKKEKKIMLLAKNVSLILLGGLGTLLMVVLPMVLMGVWKEMIETAVTYNFYYAKMWGLGFSNMLMQFSRMLKLWWFVPVPFFFFFLGKNKNQWFYFGLFLTSLLGVYQIPIGHYYIFLMPTLFILLTVGLDNLSAIIKKVPFYVYFLFCLGVMLYSVRMQFGMTPAQISLWIYGNQNPFFEAPLVAQELQKITGENDEVFIAGSEPEILFYAQRKSVSRFVITYPLIIETIKREDYQKAAVKELEGNKPTAIVYSLKQDSGLWNEESPRIFYDHLNDLINREYTLVGAYLWDGQGGRWETKVGKDRLKYVSLILFKKR